MNFVKHIALYFSLLMIVLSLCLKQGYGQTSLSFDKYMEIVRTNHPLAKAAEIQTEKGAATLLKAKGELDPKIASSLSQKYFDDKQYYSLLNAGLKIPTWVGVDIQTGFDQTDGVFLNPENTTPNGGLFYAGISIPLGQGLFIDKRRATIKDAKLFQTITSAERIIQLNALFFNAGKAYYNWCSAYGMLKVYQEAVLVSEQRFQSIKQSIQFGDRPPIDTLEAGIQVQNRQLQLQQAILDYDNSRAYLGLYLWANGQIPMALESATIPDDLEKTLTIKNNIDLNRASNDSLVSKHPMLIQYQAKKDQIDVKTKWQKEQLKPIINLKYNPITEPIDGNPLTGLSINNYTWGFEFKMPILLRKERGSLKLLDIQSKEIEYERSYKAIVIEQKLSIALNTYQSTLSQLEIYQKNRADYKRLLDGERQIFEGGESSLFMINSRETAYIKAQVQLIKTWALNQKAFLEIDYTLGVLK